MNTLEKDIFLENIPEKTKEHIENEIVNLLNQPKYKGFYLENISTSPKEANVFFQKKTP